MRPIKAIHVEILNWGVCERLRAVDGAIEEASNSCLY
jgi:hypothetical protein